jgi:hypothetical protein
MKRFTILRATTGPPAAAKRRACPAPPWGKPFVSFSDGSPRIGAASRTSMPAGRMLNPPPRPPANLRDVAGVG